MKDLQIHIRSEKFPTLENEPEEIINPGTFGKALAEYLKEKLTEKGHTVPFICCEDFGWWIEISVPPVTTDVTCRRAQDHGEGLCDFAIVATYEKEKWSWRKFRKIDISKEVSELHKTLIEIVEKDEEIEVVALDFDKFPESEQ